MAEVVDGVIESWSTSEIAIWKSRKLRYEAVRQEYEHLNATDRKVFLFSLKSGEVSLVEKPTFYTREQLGGDSRDGYVERSRIYLNFLKHVVKHHHLDADVVLAIDVSDEGGTRAGTAPVFVFQKPQGHDRLLFPDIDFLASRFYKSAELVDDTKYSEKRTSAIFLGSTTGGGLITVDAIRNASFPRLRSALFFRDNPLVDFRLTRIAQCPSPEAEKLLRDMGFGTGVLPWNVQFQNKFIISMDGNGATCARVVVALKSNSVLLKYDSPNILYYFKSLEPWRHYVPITSDRDVLNVIEKERHAPGYFESVSRQGKEFACRYLSQEQVECYTASLLRLYVDLFVNSNVSVGSKAVSSTKQTVAASRNTRDVSELEQEGHAAEAQDEVLRDRRDEHILPDLTGESYLAVLQRLHRTLRPQSYLEVGTNTGDSLTLSESPSIAVDPRFAVNRNVIGSKPVCLFYQMSSDSFFSRYRPSEILGCPIDFAFLDGHHLFEFLLRDFIKIEENARHNSVICLHDCIPTDVYMTVRNEHDHITRSRSRYPGAWTGDVWKTIVALTKFRPDLKIYPVNATPTGLIIITNLDPTSTCLRDNYFQITEELRDTDLAGFGIGRYVDSLRLIETSALQRSDEIWKYFWL